MIKPWVFEFSSVPGLPADQPPDPAALSDAFNWLFEVWTGFEDIGFEGLFLSEHHFLPKGVSPSPNLLVAALAARTKRLRLGVMGVVAPMYAPWRLAEEMGMLDVISGGRLEIGLSSGAGPQEIVRVGIPAEEVRPRFDEALDILHKALTEPVLHHQGKFWSFVGLKLTPKPVQQPTPPMWITGLSRGAGIGAGKRGWKLCTGFLATGEIAAIFDTYRETFAAGGRRATPDDVAIRRMVFLTDDRAEGTEVAAGTLARFRKAMSGPARPDVPLSARSAVPDAPAPQHQMVSDEEAIAGPPSDVAEIIVEQCRATGCGNFLAYPFADLTKQQIQRNYALWREVVPVLRKAGVA
jgi:alkanesulfonate monooxygenase SsuD/methylene tetrahydromethanopterin reductase-like flavin-dependent oxidoreductase (luciferase family)